VEDLVALADATHVGAAGLTVGYAIRFLTTQDAGASSDEAEDIGTASHCYDHSGVP
jgi:hypothetical protein